MAEIQFNCPHCEQHLEAPKELLGGTVDCPLCNGRISLADPGVAPQPSTSLKPRAGARCPRCQVVFYEKVGVCGQCGGATEPATWYSRLCWERLAFIATVACLSGVGALASGKDGGTALGVFLGAGFMTFSMYYTATYLIGIGGFSERFAEGAVPVRAHLSFSWIRYLSEFVRCVGVLVAVVVVVGVGTLLSRALSGGR
jgi:hypothetical protein